MTRSIIAVVLVIASGTSVFAQKDIVDTAVAAGSFKTLVTAVQAAGLVETLKGDGPFTVFAPTDEAFAKVPKDVLAKLLKPENKAQLQAILTYHVVPGKVMAGDVLKVGDAKTVQGSLAKFSLSIEGAKIIKTDIKCTNGVIHVIDAVIMPPKKEEKKISSSPQKMIETVVAGGSKLFNSGNACECADLYSETMVKLAKHEQIDDSTRNHIHQTLQMASSANNSSNRAWVLRRGLDTVYRQVQN